MKFIKLYLWILIFIAVFFLTPVKYSKKINTNFNGYIIKLDLKLFKKFWNIDITASNISVFNKKLYLTIDKLNFTMHLHSLCNMCYKLYFDKHNVKNYFNFNKIKNGKILKLEMYFSMKNITDLNLDDVISKDIYKKIFNDKKYNIINIEKLYITNNEIYSFGDSFYMSCKRQNDKCYNFVMKHFDTNIKAKIFLDSGVIVDSDICFDNDTYKFYIAYDNTFHYAIFFNDKVKFEYCYRFDATIIPNIKYKISLFSEKISHSVNNILNKISSNGFTLLVSGLKSNLNFIFNKLNLLKVKNVDVDSFNFEILSVNKKIDLVGFANNLQCHLIDHNNKLNQDSDIFINSDIHVNNKHYILNVSQLKFNDINLQGKGVCQLFVSDETFHNSKFDCNINISGNHMIKCLGIYSQKQTILKTLQNFNLNTINMKSEFKIIDFMNISNADYNGDKVILHSYHLQEIKPQFDALKALNLINQNKTKNFKNCIHDIICYKNIISIYSKSNMHESVIFQSIKDDKTFFSKDLYIPDHLSKLQNTFDLKNLINDFTGKIMFLCFLKLDLINLSLLKMNLFKLFDKKSTIEGVVFFNHLRGYIYCDFYKSKIFSKYLGFFKNLDSPCYLQSSIEICDNHDLHFDNIQITENVNKINFSYFNKSYVLNNDNEKSSNRMKKRTNILDGNLKVYDSKLHFNSIYYLNKTSCKAELSYFFKTNRLNVNIKSKKIDFNKVIKYIKLKKTPIKCYSQKINKNINNIYANIDVANGLVNKNKISNLKLKIKYVNNKLQAEGWFFFNKIKSIITSPDHRMILYSYVNNLCQLFDIKNVIDTGRLTLSIDVNKKLYNIKIKNGYLSALNNNRWIKFFFDKNIFSANINFYLKKNYIKLIQSKIKTPNIKIQFAGHIDKNSNKIKFNCHTKFFFPFAFLKYFSWLNKYQPKFMKSVVNRNLIGIKHLVVGSLSHPILKL